MDNVDTWVIGIMIGVMVLILLDFVLTIFILPKKNNKDDVFTNMYGVPYFCKSHTWQYDKKSLLYCSVCHMRLGDNKSEINNED